MTMKHFTAAALFLALSGCAGSDAVHPPSSAQLAAPSPTIPPVARPATVDAPQFASLPPAAEASASEAKEVPAKQAKASPSSKAKQLVTSASDPCGAASIQHLVGAPLSSSLGMNVPAEARYYGKSEPIDKNVDPARLNFVVSSKTAVDALMDPDAIYLRIFCG